MSEDDKPIFPRPTDISDAEKQKLYQETQQKLENAEQTVDDKLTKVYCSNCQADNSSAAIFCRVCGNPLNTPLAPTNPEEIKIEPTAVAIMYGPPAMMLDDKLPTKTVELPNDTLKKLLPDDIHTTMYGPAPMVIDDLPKTAPHLRIETKNAPVLGLDYEEWKGRIPWLIIGGIIGFLTASVIILTLVLLVVAIR